MDPVLDFSFRLSNQVVPTSSGPRLIYALAEVFGGQGAQALPANLGFVIDTSDSMRIRLVTENQFEELLKSGLAHEVMTDGVPAYQISSMPGEWMSQLPRRIDYVSDALRLASQLLREQDHFSLVAFASQAKTVVQQTAGKDRDRLYQAALEIESIMLGDETHMAEGLEMGFNETLPPPGGDFATRLILLTDGHTRNVRECYEWAKKAYQAGVKLTTLGIGAEFNEELLIPLADLTGGNAYYAETPDRISAAFQQELGSALRISCRNVEIKLQLGEGAQLRRVFRVLPELGDFDQGPEMDGSFALLLGDYSPGSPIALLLELVVAEGPPGAHRLAHAMLAWDALNGVDDRHRKRYDVMIERSDTMIVQLDQAVMDVVERVGAFKMGTKALEAAQSAANGENHEAKGEATIRLRQAATRLLDMGEASLAGAMFHQAEVLESKGNLDPEEAKKLRYETRRLTKR